MANQRTSRLSARPLDWLADYELRWLGADCLAGITLAAYAVPVALAYATLAGLPPEVGIYGYLLGGLGYALLGSSRQLAIGPTSAISLMVGVSIAPLAAGDPVRHAQIAALVALLVAFLALVAFALHLSTLTSFISDTILVGFKAGAGLSIATTQLPNALGVGGGGDHFFERLVTIARQMGDANPAVVGVTVAALVLLLAGNRWLPGRPVALAVVILSIVATSVLGLQQLGVTTVGTIPAGLPSFAFPGLRVRDVEGVIPLAAACLLLGYIESVSAARALASRHGYDVDVRREMLALGGANLAVAFGHGYPVAGGLSQSVVNEKAGAKSPAALVIASFVLGFSLVFLTGLLESLPKAVLAAIVLVAVTGLIDLREIARLRHVSRLEFRVAMIALIGVLLLGILKGVLLAVVASILLLLHRAAYPHIAVLGRIPNTRRYSDLERNPDNEPVPGVLIVRVEASLMYFNVDNVLRQVLERAREQQPPVRLVICDLSTSPYVDLAGARMLARLSTDLAARGIALRLAETRASVRDVLRSEGLDETAGPISRHISVANVIEAFQERTMNWFLAFVPAVFVCQWLAPEAHTPLFLLSVLAIVPLARLLSHATESVAAKTGDMIGGLLNASLGNLTELVIALTALRAGQYMLVKASVAGAIVTNTLFMLGASFLLGGLVHHVQEYNRIAARLQAGLLFLATVALLVPSAVSQVDSAPAAAFTQTLSLSLSVLLIVAYGLGLLFSLRTHPELFGSAEHAETEETPWPLGVALATLAGVTVLVALVSEIFVESVQQAAASLGLTPAFVGFIVVALVGGAAEMTSAFAAARKNRLDLSVGIALGSASQIALFVAPVLVLVSYVVGPAPMSLQFWPGAVVMMFFATMTASLVTNSGRSTWFVGVLILMVYAIFATTLFLLPPGT